MTVLERQLLDALWALERTVAAMNTTGSRPNLHPIFTLIDDLAVQLPSGSAPQLLHFLQNRSYSAARLWLEGRHREIEGCAFEVEKAVAAPLPAAGHLSWAFWRRHTGGASTSP